MLTFLLTLLGIIVTILLVVGVHESGHFIVARLMGVKVLRFSIGFGKTLRRWHDKKGTEYVLAAIPLGGYIKMLDETEGNVSPEELHLAYNRQPVYKRIPIIIAGPLFNLIFAFILYWILFVAGFTTVAPVIGNITPHSIAASAGLKPQQEIIGIDQHPAHTWMSITIHLISRAGETGILQIDTKNIHSGVQQKYFLNITHWQLDALKPDPFSSLGIVPYEPVIPAIIGKIDPDSQAAHSPLQINDKIIALNHKPINQWIDFITLVAEHPDETFPITIMRQGKTIFTELTIGSKRNLFFHRYGFLGVSPQFEWPANFLRQNKYGVIDAIPEAWQQVKNFTYLNFLSIGKMLTGKLSVQSVGGPITIFTVAGSAFSQGPLTFLSFLAFLSISIGIINLLPIPGLDGGHLLFQLIEIVLRRPVSQRVQMLFFRLGMILLLLIFAQAFMNDVMRF